MYGTLTDCTGTPSFHYIHRARGNINGYQVHTALVLHELPALYRVFK
jgi:hypothetical protein